TVRSAGGAGHRPPEAGVTTRTRPGVAAVVLALAGCGTTVASDAPTATDASPVTSVTSAPRVTSSASVSASSSISISSSASSDGASSDATTTTTHTAGRDAMSTTTYHRTVVAADAGSVEAQYVDGVLDVHIES